ncbi:Adenosine kinase 2, partial [Armadillidium nasatum]
PNNAILAEEKHMPLYNEIEEKYDVEYYAGGATQNSMRVTQWILGEPLSCSYMGCVGRDKHSKTLEEKARDSGVNVKYEYNDKYPTGTCAVVVTKNGTCRSLVANLAAANHFSKSHLQIPENKEIINKAKYFYISGFFLTVSPESILEVGRHASENNKVFSMNLSAPFLCEFFSEPMMKAFPYIDILFGNETVIAFLGLLLQEAAKFSEVQKLGTSDVREIALRAAELPKENENRSRIVIVTQGADNVVVAKDGKVQEFPATKLPDEKLIDTNGAGDAFVGGFLAQLVQEKPLEECIKCAIWAATQVIQQPGCTFPEGVRYEG